jgi:pimeloyl-ACP methyl ester carboxylesterase
LADAFAVRRFDIDVGEPVLADLRDRILRTRWPPPSPGPAWGRGTDLEYLRDLVGSWAEFDWRSAERDLNRWSHFLAEVDGVRIHFVHQRARSGNGIPLILTHGWPSCFVELLPLVPLLTDPAAHGIDGPAFDVVLPSLPGYGFSERPDRTDVTYRFVAGLWHGLMRGLGYQRYGAGGGDFGSGVTTFMALDDPGPLIGLHLTTLEIESFTGPGSRPPSEEERAFLEASERWVRDEYAYGAIQSTKPQTLSYGLQDSPAGLAAWIVEKWRSWSDCGGDLESRFSREFLLTILTLYWATGTISTSIRDYADNRRWQGEPKLTAADRVRVPTAVAVFPHMLVPEGEPPREWAERLYDVARWTRMSRGGHFAAAEEPELLARDIAAFFAGTGSPQDRP